MAQTTSSQIMTVLVLIGAFTGCTRSIDILPAVTSDTETAAATIASTERVPLILDTVKITHNGSPQNPSTELDRRLLGSLQTLNLFSGLSMAETAPLVADDKAIVAHLTVEDTVDSHPGEAAWKGVVIGASMFLLSPVMELHYDYGTHLTLELERWDGTVKTYRAESSGVARYNLFSASPSMITELKGHVMETGITELMNQLVKDTAFYNASSAPVGERAMYSVSVKTTRRTPPAVSVSTAAPSQSR